MDLLTLMQGSGALWSPLTIALLVGLAVGLIWMAFAPARPQQEVDERLNGYLTSGDAITEAEMRQSFASRALFPLVRRILAVLGRLAPKGGADATQRMLVQAGSPWGLSALDFWGLRLLSTLLLAGGYYLLLGRTLTFSEGSRGVLLLALVGYLLPYLWMRRRARQRQHEIACALPDALDMMTVGVEAGLAFESAMLKVGERWDNALTQELRRVVAETRVGTAREVALRRMAERTGVGDLQTFVAVLVQSNQLGVSIAQVLHGQADLMRVRRRQRAEELARQAGVKMVFPLVFLIFPALYVVVLGPAVPGIISLFATMAAASPP